MKSLLYNCRILEPDNALIRTTVELFHRVLTQNGQAVPLASIEYVCPCSDRTYSWKGNVRKSTLKRAREVAKVIKSVWDSV